MSELYDASSQLNGRGTIKRKEKSDHWCCYEFSFFCNESACWPKLDMGVGVPSLCHSHITPTHCCEALLLFFLTIFCISSPLCTLGQIGVPRRSALRYCPLPQGPKDRRGKQKRRKTAAVRTIPPCAGWQRAVKCLKRVKSDNKL